MNTQNSIRTLAALVLSALLSGCGSSSVSVQATRIGGITIDSTMMLAVGTITGDHAKGFRKNLAGALRQNGDFTVFGADPDNESAPDSTLKRVAASRAENHLALILITGNYNSDKEEETKTQGKDNYTGPSYTEKKVTGTFSYQIYDLSNHKALLTREVVRQKVQKDVPNLKELLQDVGSTLGLAEDPLEQEVRKEVVAGFIGELYRHEEGYTVEFVKDSELPELEKGISFASVGNWDSAIERFGEVIKKNPGHANIHKAYYDLGVSYKCAGKYPEAHQNLEKAYVLKNDTRYFDELQSVLQFEREDKIREEQNVRHPG
jgi:tetratricopeptide (TPR) repeat protein